jgi:hypothetical protein
LLFNESCVVVVYVDDLKVCGTPEVINQLHEHLQNRKPNAPEKKKENIFPSTSPLIKENSSQHKQGTQKPYYKIWTPNWSSRDCNQCLQEPICCLVLILFHLPKLSTTAPPLEK